MQEFILAQELRITYGEATFSQRDDDMFFIVFNEDMVYDYCDYNAQAAAHWMVDTQVVSGNARKSNDLNIMTTCADFPCAKPHDRVHPLHGLCREGVLDIHMRQWSFGNWMVVLDSHTPDISGVNDAQGLGNIMEITFKRIDERGLGTRHY